ncbi:MAG TPA: hypothetical protein VJ728_11360 [Candidatus Binataceae bacterium]|nr:hypothetical protein [Candidatus Binataceae bacterium]
MAPDHEHGSSRAAESISRRPRRLLLLAGTTGASFIVLITIVFYSWVLRAGRDGDDDLGNRVPPGVLADYMPEDSAAVLVVNVRQLRETAMGRQNLWPSIQQLTRQIERRLPWLRLAGINPLDDLDTLLISFASKGSGEPILLARGQFDRSRLQIGPDKLQESTLDHYRIWEYSEPDVKQTTLIALVGATLVVSETRSRVQAALRQASDPQPIRVHDTILRQMLAKVDRRQSLWLAASIKGLGSISTIDNYLLKMILRPLAAHAESVYGGIAFTEDLQAELHFSTCTDDDADRLEADLKSICEAAPGITLLGRNNELLPLLRLLAVGQISREGKNILLRCRLTADQLEK